jgi:hypothetical protein
MAGNNQLQGQSEEFRGLRLIPLVVRWAAGTPSIVSNPLNEAITVGDTGTGDVLLTLAEASLAPIIVGSVIGLGVNQYALKAAPTSTVVALLTELDDGTAADPVDLHIVLYKTIAN